MKLPTLERYSKPRRAGDQTSGGRGKLLKPTSALSRIELLVRETLQNSWDARVDDDDWTPAYGLRVYRMEPRVQDVLREHVFTELPSSLSALEASLREPEVHAIEIYDRGTVGLNGPYRASEYGEPNNFTSFVFDIGTTKSGEHTGGTYGFGKTAAFEVSNAHSVVYWSRCRGTDGRIEHRLIASSLHEPYQFNGARYTGAHWWGELEADGDVTPIRGEAAERLGEAIFRTHFGDAEDGDPETGTSILILDPIISYAADGDDDSRERVPVRTERHAQALLRQVTDALAHSAWPKVVPDDDGLTPMLVGLYENGVDRDVAGSMLEQYGTFVSALDTVRAVQDRGGRAAVAKPRHLVRQRTFPIALRRPRVGGTSAAELFSGRTQIVVGHLHLIQTVQNPPAKTSAPVNTLCLMRYETELVVRYDPVVDDEANLLQWHGVFKPTQEFDKHFRASEPPTHDQWTPDSADDEASRYVVKKTLERLRAKTRAFLSESRPAEDGGQRQSVRNVAMELRTFVPFGAAPEESEEKSPRRNARRARTRAYRSRGGVEIVEARALPGGEGQVLELIPTSSDGARTEVRAAVYALTSDGRLPLGDDEVRVEWAVGGVRSATGTRCAVDSGTEVQVTVRTRSATALEIGFEIEAVA